MPLDLACFRDCRQLRFVLQLKEGACKLFRSCLALRFGRSSFFFLLCLLGPAVLVTSAFAAAPAVGNAAERTRTLQRVLDRVKEQLGLDAAVAIELVPENKHLVSVEAPGAAGGTYTVRIEERLLAVLAEDELEAALAHELGHVWVFTHHPFLQTESGANDVALRVVTRGALRRVYEKVWQGGGGKGTLETFLGSRLGATGQQ